MARLTPEDWRMVRAAFEASLEHPMTEREAHLRQALASREELLEEALRLLALERAATGFLEISPPPTLASATGSASASDAEPDPWIGAEIGPYRVVRSIASGGMGRVYEATQSAPERRVALKMMRASLATPSALTRFRYEVELSTRLRHPSIAHVYASGVQRSASGESAPWFAMELIEGARSLTEHAQERRLSLPARLELFAEVAEGVLHAHERGVLHRDLKPANLLVDAQGHAKVIDFGIARAMESEEGASPLTREGDLLGTLRYMSPERLAGENDPDVRGDVYALGVVLYELTTDRAPFEIATRSAAAALRCIEAGAPAPSAVKRELPRELDWIVRKAMAFDRAERYASVAALLEDLRRFEREEPLAAGPPSARYRARKFLRRHRVLVAASAAVFLALAVGLAGTWTGFLRAREAEELALAQRDDARRESARSQAVVEFLLDLFRRPDPAVDGRELKMVDALDRSTQAFEMRFAEQLDVRAWLARTVGRAYEGLGLYAEAGRALEAALVDHRARFGEAHVDTGRVRLELALLRLEEGRLDDAAAQLASAREVFSRALEPGSLDALRAEVIEGRLLLARNERERAIEVLRRAVEELRARHGEQHLVCLEALNTLAGVHHERGELAEALPLYRAAHAGFVAVRGARHPLAIAAWNNRVMLDFSRGERASALQEMEEIVALRREVLGEAHRDTVGSLCNLGGMYYFSANLERAGSCWREGWTHLAASLPPEHPTRQTLAMNLATVEKHLGRHAEAEQLMREVLAVREKSLGPGHERTLLAQSELGDLARLRGDLPRAQELLAAAWARAQEALAAENATRHSIGISFGRALLAQQRYAEAEEHLLAVLAGQAAVEARHLAKQNMYRVEPLLHELYERLGRPAEAEKYRQDGAR